MFAPAFSEEGTGLQTGISEGDPMPLDAYETFMTLEFVRMIRDETNKFIASSLNKFCGGCFLQAFL